MKTVNDLINELSAFSADKRELPVKVVAENGLLFEAKPKMYGEYLHLGGCVTEIVITYD